MMQVISKQEAIERAGGASALAKILKIRPAAVAQWGDELPLLRQYQLRDLRPEWFKK